MGYEAGRRIFHGDFNAIEDAIEGNGVVSGMTVSAKSPASMILEVSTGVYYADGQRVEKASTTDVTVTTADTIKPRKDIIVGDSSGNLTVVAGTAQAAQPAGKTGMSAEYPLPPDIPSSKTIIREVWVEAGATAIEDTDHFDRRVVVRPKSIVTLTVAASDSADPSKADYKCNGTADEVEINAAIAAVSSTGARISLLDGTFKTAGKVHCNRSYTHINGQGIEATIVETQTADIDAFEFGDGSSDRYSMSLGNLAVKTATGKTGGAGVKFNKVVRAHLHDFLIDGQYYGVDMQQTYIGWLQRGTIWNTVATNGISVRMDGTLATPGCNIYLDHVIAKAPSDEQPLAGIRILQGGGYWITDCDFVHQGYGLLVDPASTFTVNWLFVDNSCFDSCTNANIRFNPASGGTVKAVRLSDCWAAASAAGQGVLIGGSGTLDGLWLHGCMVRSNETHGIEIVAGQNIGIENCQIWSNSRGGSGTYHGISIAASVNEWQITNCEIGDMAGETEYQGYGIHLTSPVGDNYIITNNDLRGNVTGALYGASYGSTKIVRDNLGFVTENAGTSSIDSGNTSKVVAHGLSATPTKINIAFREQGTNDYGRWWVDTIGATNFTVNVSADPGASNLDFAWEAKIR